MSGTAPFTAAGSVPAFTSAASVTALAHWQHLQQLDQFQHLQQLHQWQPRISGTIYRSWVSASIFNSCISDSLGSVAAFTAAGSVTAWDQWQHARQLLDHCQHLQQLHQWLPRISASIYSSISDSLDKWQHPLQKMNSDSISTTGSCQHLHQLHHWRHLPKRSGTIYSSCISDSLGSVAALTEADQWQHFSQLDH